MGDDIYEKIAALEMTIQWQKSASACKIKEEEEAVEELKRQIEKYERETAQDFKKENEMKEELNKTNRNVDHLREMHQRLKMSKAIVEEHERNLEKRWMDLKEKNAKQQNHFKSELQKYGDILEKYYTKYESSETAKETLGVKMRLNETKEKLSELETKVRKTKELKIEKGYGGKWKKFTDIVVRIATLKLDTNKNEVKIQEIRDEINEERKQELMCLDEIPHDKSSNSARNDDPHEMETTNDESSSKAPSLYVSAISKQTLPIVSSEVSLSLPGTLLKTSTENERIQAVPKTPMRPKPPTILLPPRSPSVVVPSRSTVSRPPTLDISKLLPLTGRVETTGSQDKPEISPIKDDTSSLIVNETNRDVFKTPGPVVVQTRRLANFFIPSPRGSVLVNQSPSFATPKPPTFDYFQMPTSNSDQFIGNNPFASSMDTFETPTRGPSISRENDFHNNRDSFSVEEPVFNLFSSQASNELTPSSTSFNQFGFMFNNFESPSTEVDQTQTLF